MGFHMMARRWALAPSALIALALAACLTPALADDYPQWRGPQRDGISKEAGLLKEWPAGGPKLVWQIKEAGFGYGSPAVAGSRIYLISNQGADNETVQALDAKDGKQLWSLKLGKVGNPNQMPNYPGARSTPTVDKGVVYALGSDGDLVAAEAASGKELWRKSLRADFGGAPGTWAYAESPLIDGDAVVCAPGGAQATIVALNKKTGAPIWKCALPSGEPAAYASIVAAQIGGAKQYVAFLGKGVVGVDAATGKFLWRYDKTVGPADTFTPIIRGDTVFTTASRVGGALVRVNGGQVEEAYFSQKLPTAIGGAVLVGDSLFGTTGIDLMCVDFATGSVKWQEKCVGAGSICAADGRLYVHGENGDVALVEVSSAGYAEKGRFTPPDPPARTGGTKAWAYPVVASGRLYIRDLGCLWCYDVKGK